MQVQYNQILSGSRLASAARGLGRDDELRRSLLRIEIKIYLELQGDDHDLVQDESAEIGADW